MTQRDKMKIPKLYCTSRRSDILEYHLYILWNVDRERHFWSPNWPFGQKWKFQKLTAQLQNMSNQILEYNLATTYHVDGVQVTRNSSDGRGLQQYTQTFFRKCKNNKIEKLILVQCHLLHRYRRHLNVCDIDTISIVIYIIIIIVIISRMSTSSIL